MYQESLKLGIGLLETLSNNYLLFNISKRSPTEREHKIIFSREGSPIYFMFECFSSGGDHSPMDKALFYCIVTRRIGVLEINFGESWGVLYMFNLKLYYKFKGAQPMPNEYAGIIYQTKE